MAVTVEAVYEGDLHCTVEHGPSGDRFPTDAPVDNRGRGAHFSPTDLVGASIGSCMLTILAMAAEDRGLDVRGARAVVLKEMGRRPRRHISKLAIRIRLPGTLEERDRRVLEGAARSCPVAASLGSLTEIELRFEYV